MAYVNGTTRDQIRLFVSWEEEIAADNPVRLADAFVDGLEMDKLGFTHAVPAGTGRPAPPCFSNCTCMATSIS